MSAMKARSAVTKATSPTHVPAHADPQDVSLQTALEALSDPVRRMILVDLSQHPEWTRACGTFDLPVGKTTRSHHFTVLRAAGLLEQRDEGVRRLNRLRRPEFDRAFPGLLDAVLGKTDAPGRSG
jgi:DNA-binding transcriptional ArsR family regulator